MELGPLAPAPGPPRCGRCSTVPSRRRETSSGWGRDGLAGRAGRRAGGIRIAGPDDAIRVGHEQVWAARVDLDEAVDDDRVTNLDQIEIDRGLPAQDEPAGSRAVIDADRRVLDCGHEPANLETRPR